jgi:Flp pilus assembly protein TadD
VITRENAQKILICLGLTLGTILLYSPAITFDFVNYDDVDYILNNYHIKAGLNWQQLGWCFLPGYASNWHPLTWMSHALDCQLYGLNPAGHHATSVLLHALNSALLFLLLNRMTGALWRCALVAALFAWHPLHVESVAWVSERKDVLSCLFMILTVWAYLRYAEKGRMQNAECKMFYLLSLVFFALGLMSKPMLVTLPFVLLLLDYWPLQRLNLPFLNLNPNPKSPAMSLRTQPTGGPVSDEGFRRRDADGCDRDGRAPLKVADNRRLLIEKIPFFLLSGLSCFLTIYAQNRGGAIQPLTSDPIFSRLANCLVAYCEYLARVFYPVNLSVIYMLDKNLPAWKPLAAGLLLAAITVAAARLRKTRPYFLVGWLWFLGTLVPVIGLLQVGGQGIADRYTYIPSIGLFIVLCWGINDLCASRRFRPTAFDKVARTSTPASSAGVPPDGAPTLAAGRRQNPQARTPALHFVTGPGFRPAIVGALAWAALGVCALLTSRQLQFWANTEVLFRHAAEVTPGNWVAHATLAGYYANGGQLDKARAECDESIRIDSAYAPAYEFLGVVLLRQGKLNEAASNVQKALQISPKQPYYHLLMGEVLFAQNLPDQAAEQFKAMLNFDSGNPTAHCWLGKCLASQGKLDEACSEFDEAVREDPSYAEGHYELAVAFSMRQKATGAVAHYRIALRFSPDDPRALNNLAWILAANPRSEIRDGAEAVRLAEHACQITHDSEPLFLGTLAAAYAEAGRFDEAVATAQHAHDVALNLAQNSHDAAEAKSANALAARNLELLALYRSHQPCHEK